MNRKIVIVGGGASGMLAAIVAKNNGSDVILIERNDRLGKKLLATGNGRCNYTNIYLTIDNYSGKNPKFAYSALSSLDSYMTIDYFERLGITPAIENNGKVFPQSFQSSSVLDILRLELDRLDVKVELNTFVKDIMKENDKFIIKTDNKNYTADKVILATGGNAMPISGSDGNGYSICKKLNHKIIKPLPGLVQLNLQPKGKLFKQIKGVKVPGKVALYINDEFIKEDSGDVLFTDYGISGPPILQLSSKALIELDNKKDVTLRVSLILNQEENKLIDYLVERFMILKNRTVFEGLIGLINKKLIRPILEEVGINPDKNTDNLSKDEIIKLAKIILSWEFKVIGSQGFKHAQVTSGGVDTEEIDPKSMESKLVDGLYIVGELLDINGDCGGFNLQWAWSTAYVSALHASNN